MSKTEKANTFRNTHRRTEYMQIYESTKEHGYTENCPGNVGSR